MAETTRATSAAAVSNPADADIEKHLMDLMAALHKEKPGGQVVPISDAAPAATVAAPSSPDDEMFMSHLLRLAKENEEHKDSSAGNTALDSQLPAAPPASQGADLEDELNGLLTALRKENPDVPAKRRPEAVCAVPAPIISGGSTGSAAAACRSSTDVDEDLFTAQLMRLARENEAQKKAAGADGEAAAVAGLAPSADIEDDVRGLISALRRERPGTPPALRSSPEDDVFTAQLMRMARENESHNEAASSAVRNVFEAETTSEPAGGGIEKDVRELMAALHKERPCTVENVSAVAAADDVDEDRFVEQLMRLARENEAHKATADAATAPERDDANWTSYGTEEVHRLEEFDAFSTVTGASGYLGCIDAAGSSQAPVAKPNGVGVTELQGLSALLGQLDGLEGITIMPMTAGAVGEKRGRPESAPGTSVVPPGEQNIMAGMQGILEALRRESLAKNSP